ncbi:hypothetical protein, partial [Klebsiella pneumoniae]|uniref:hypothetical protein n=1 Tax=Klebsiella pneumoniae TaxID=573 RepID=UPI002FF43A12
MGSCAAPSAKGDDKFITTDYLQQCHAENNKIKQPTLEVLMRQNLPVTGRNLELPKDANILS